MFFVISKILSFLFSPFTWILALLALAVFLKNPKKKKRFLIAALASALFFSNTFIAKEFMRLWEPSPVPVTSLQKHYSAAIVLGGGMVTADSRYNSTSFRHNTDRIMQAIWLYNNGVVDKIVISGGSGSLQFRNMLEGSILYHYLCDIGIPADDMLIDSLSDNTHQNAVNTAILLNDSLPGENYLLITSASHMRRSLGCFHHEGIEADPFPVDFTAGERSWDVMNLIVPKAEAFVIWEELLHEIVGSVIYRIVGYW
ncbi:MAG: hypothetical protein CVU11_12065 [Bacteroidetes bacterium HGW-Bacteroidetes-6]|jgi:uncharacterized SAM-binding protein YcdF (DUF218 family)|nr:MAG: hypothetical protein CVU11_12065 [Bacteroidetes bacterium HGW-Bacteroidetes-6]